MTYSAFAYGVCRATYAAEQSVQKLEKGKKDQDLLIDHLQQQLRTHEQQIAIYSQQYDAQKRETRAAKEMLAGAEAEMEGIHFEKKQLTAQWQSSLIATQRRDQALRVSMSNAQTKKGECLCTIQLTAVFGGTCILAYS
jgi:peptidoglycan hydrolase CwlO-like protein